jgi:8-oxo-dGTP pyrophosphatase MutT (NUDIX family)
MAVAQLRPASTVILLRPSPARFDVFLVRRSDSVAFMGGAHVFPGGRVDDADRLDGTIAVDGADAAAARMPDVPAEQAVAHSVAALRELFEEAGVLLARRDDRIERIAPVLTTDGDAFDRFAAHRRALLAHTTTFAKILVAEGARLALDEIRYFAHWVTPDIEIKRFDTRFFVARAPAGQTPVHDEGETTHSEWLDPLDAIDRSRNGEIALPPPTWTTLSRLAKFRTIDEVMAWAARTPIPRVQPRFVKRGDETLLFYPGDPLYPPLEGFETPEDTRFVLKDRRWRPVKPD